MGATAAKSGAEVTASKGWMETLKEKCGKIPVIPAVLAGIGGLVGLRWFLQEEQPTGIRGVISRATPAIIKKYKTPFLATAGAIIAAGGTITAKTYLSNTVSEEAEVSEEIVEDKLTISKPK